jgi:hypothetical protein
VVEVHARALEPELARQRDRAGGGAVLVARVDRRALEPQEDEVDVVGQEGDSADRGRGVEPVPDAAAPQQDAVVRADRGERRPDRRRVRRAGRIGRHPERHDDHVVERVGLEQLAQRQAAEPEVALALAGADDEVSGGQVRRGGARHDAAQAGARGGGLLARGLDHLDDGRVVEVDGESGRLAPDAVEQARRQQLRDDHVVLAHRRGQRVVVGEPGLQQRDAVVGELARRRSGERDAAVRSQRARQLIGADRRSRHPLAD